MQDSTDWIVGEGWRVRLGEERVFLEDHFIPRTFELSHGGEANDGPDPEVRVRVQVSDNGVPKVVELHLLTDDPLGAGIRQADLRAIQITEIVEEFLPRILVRVRFDGTSLSFEDTTSHFIDDEGNPRPFDDTNFEDARRLLSRRRANRGITPELLERVAKVYRDNIDTAPNKAIERHFQVSQRMAAEYVSRARKHGLLPPTKRGKKQA